jgi:hypothetical protein
LFFYDILIHGSS